MAKTNALGLTVKDYKAAPSTLCPGCGHEVITQALIRVFWELSIPQHKVIKLSGIGCSSKTPAYFLGYAQGFNGVHGRMPSMATGALVANRHLLGVGVSGDGDTASIGMGQFVHLIRRNLPMLYIVENNGVYGLTKGQFSATADIGSTLKSGIVNELPPIDLCTLAIELGCGFVARSFAGDVKQLQKILKAALNYPGLSIVDVISPCVTYNNHPASTKSYDYTKDHEAPLHEIDFVPSFDHPIVEQKEGETLKVPLYDGSTLLLKPIDPSYDPMDRDKALQKIHQGIKEQVIFTGILYIEENKPTFYDILNLPEEPLAQLPEEKLKPPEKILREIEAQFRG